MKGAFICPYCKTENACSCPTCKPHISEGEFVNRWTEDGENMICGKCDKVYSPDQAMEEEWKQRNQKTNNQFQKMEKEGNQTAVDQLMSNLLGFIHDGHHPEVLEFYKKAKDLEKDQEQKFSASWAKSREQTRETSMHIGFARGFMSGLQCYEDYYQELEKTDLDEDEFTRNYITDAFEEAYGGGEQ